MTLATSRCISRQHNVTALLYPVYKTASQTTITCHSLSLKCLLSLFHRDQIYVTACCLLGQTECFFFFKSIYFLTEIKAIQLTKV